MRIESPQNPKYKAWHKLRNGRGVRKAGATLLAGAKRVADAVVYARNDILGILLCDGTAPPHGYDGPLYTLPQIRFQSLDPAGTGGPIAWMRTHEPAPFTGESLPDGISLFLPLQDPENLGTALRSAHALGAAQAVLLPGAAHPFHPRTLRAAGLAPWRLPLCRLANLTTFPQWHLPLVGLDANGRTSLDAYQPSAPIGLVVGAEGTGLTALPTLPETIRIPIDPSAESLNAAAAAAIALYDLQRKLAVSTPRTGATEQ